MSTNPYDTIPRWLRRDIKNAGAENVVRAEIAAAIDDIASELEAVMDPRAALSFASAEVPKRIASAILLRAHIQKIEKQIAEQRQGVLASCAIELPDDMPPESHVLARMVRRRLALYVQES